MSIVAFPEPRIGDLVSLPDFADIRVAEIQPINGGWNVYDNKDGRGAFLGSGSPAEIKARPLSYGDVILGPTGGFWRVVALYSDRVRLARVDEMNIPTCPNSPGEERRYEQLYGFRHLVGIPVSRESWPSIEQRKTEASSWSTDQDPLRFEPTYPLRFESTSVSREERFSRPVDYPGKPPIGIDEVLFSYRSGDGLKRLYKIKKAKAFVAKVYREYVDREQIGIGLSYAGLLASKVTEFARLLWETDLEVVDRVSEFSDHTVGEGDSYECDWPRYLAIKEKAWERDEDGLRSHWENRAFHVLGWASREPEKFPILWAYVQRGMP